MRPLAIKTLVFCSVLILAWPGVAHASCIPLTAGQQERQADVILVGRAVEGPTPTGVQRFEVLRYLKGSGPSVARIDTGVISRSDGSGTLTSVSIEAAAGERWRIYATRGAGGDVLQTNVCLGSSKLASEGPAPVSGPIDSSGSAGRSGISTPTIVLSAILASVALLALVSTVRRRVSRPATS